MAPSSGSKITFNKHYFNDPTLSDLTIRLSDRTVHVHRIVLCRRSAYFEKLILGGFKVSTTGGSRVIALRITIVCRSPASRKSDSMMTIPML